MTSATRAIIGLAIENDASMDAGEKAALLARIDGAGMDEGGEPLLTVASMVTDFPETTAGKRDQGFKP